MEYLRNVLYVTTRTFERYPGTYESDSKDRGLSPGAEKIIKELMNGHELAGSLHECPGVNRIPCIGQRVSDLTEYPELQDVMDGAEFLPNTMGFRPWRPL